MELTQGTDFDAFSSDKRTIKAVLYNLAVIGEAARRAPQEVTEKYLRLPWQEMNDMRNVLIHEYFGVDLKIIWETIHHDLPALLPLLEDILSRE